MPETRKTDNHNLPAKLALRRHFLRAYHADDLPHVMDCCQGGGKLWSTLRSEFPVAAYWGIDTKPKKGRLQIDSVRVLAQPGWPQNVIDVDTYGSPFKHWAAMLPNVVRPLTVFLTIGHLRLGGLDGYIIESLGLGHLDVPAGIKAKIHDRALPYCLSRCREHGVEIVAALEAASTGSARYIGLRLNPPGRT